MTAIAYIDTSTALDAGVVEGFTADPGGAIYDRLCSSLKWGEREPLETDPSCVQLIPYVLVWRPGEVFLTQRLEGGSEERLHGQVSAGIGGHVEHFDADRDFYDASVTLHNAAEREVLEEVKASGWNTYDLAKPHGFIYDTSSAVSRVHLGVVFTLRVDDCEVRETEVLRGMWAKIADLEIALEYPTISYATARHHTGFRYRVTADDLESWARFALEHLDDLIGDYAAAGE